MFNLMYIEQNKGKVYIYTNFDILVTNAVISLIDKMETAAKHTCLEKKEFCSAVRQNIQTKVLF